MPRSKHPAPRSAIVNSSMRFNTRMAWHYLRKFAEKVKDKKLYCVRVMRKKKAYELRITNYSLLAAKKIC
jgi:hypothetical protein